MEWVLFVVVVAVVVIGGLTLLRGLVEGFNRCPHCRKSVPRKASRCPHCTAEL